MLRSHGVTALTSRVDRMNTYMFHVFPRCLVAFLSWPNSVGILNPLQSFSTDNLLQLIHEVSWNNWNDYFENMNISRSSRSNWVIEDR